MLNLETIPNSNYLPSETEITHIRKIASNTKHRLSQLTKLVDQSTNVTKSLLTKRQELHNRLNSCNLALAPHRKLPEDVIRHIFTFCVSETTDLSLLPGSQQLPDEVILTHVCSSWRRIALSTPSLWSNILVSISDEISLFMAKEWVHRAGQALITMNLNLEYIESTSYEFVVRELMYDRRFNLLILALSSLQLSELHNKLQNIKRLHIESLDLVVQVCHSHGQSSLPSLELGQSQCAHLHTVHLSSHFGLEINPRMFSLPWNQLRDLKVGPFVTVSQCLELLQQCTSLQTCRLAICKDENATENPSFDPSLDVVTLPCLHSLFIQYRSGNCLYQLLQHLILPNLERFDAQPFRLNMKGGGGANVGVLLRSLKAPHLQEVSFHLGIDLDDVSLHEIATGTLAPVCAPEGIIALVESRSESATEMRFDSCRVVPFISVRIECLLNYPLMGKWFEQRDALRKAGIEF
ncbi:hypothetical protein AMATHDRAFT_50728 [Amanita thiersii Skay4041]|uniref:Uncharacterized protein n=1 Tax=Amanita thiersii Skay4041 TaxID=703135 RepID=A0A2A9NF31_9AGAR|nr:hypothetical protein AMATHDRAFT_50728 [Amanita thiersii Skay4041]